MESPAKPGCQESVRQLRSLKSGPISRHAAECPQIPPKQSSPNGGLGAFGGPGIASFSLVTWPIYGSSLLSHHDSYRSVIQMGGPPKNYNKSGGVHSAKK